VFDCHLVDLGILRCDQHDAVAEQIDAGRHVDVLLVDGVVHPVGVGGHENIRRGTLLDLLGERRTRGIARHHLDAGLGGVGSVDVIEGVLHRSRGEHREALVLGKCGRPDRSAQQQEGQGKSGETMHWALHACMRRDFPRANQALVEDRCDRRKRRSVHPAAYGRSGYRWQNNNRLTGRVKGPLVYCDGRIATDKALSLAPLISSTNGLAEISYFMVLRIPSQSVAPLKPLGFRAWPSWMTSIQAPADRLMV